MASESTGIPSDETWGTWFINELTGSYINMFLLLTIFYLTYKIFKQDSDDNIDLPAQSPSLSPMKKRDFTLEQLKPFNGTEDEATHGRLLVAVNGKVFDVTKGKQFYGQGGPYAVFAGRDASRGLATFTVEPSDDYDDLSDLKPSEMDQVREWELQFSEKYDFVGKLLKPGEEPTTYSESEEEEEENLVKPEAEKIEAE